MLLEDVRLIHEDLERLEQAIADRVAEEPKQARDRLQRDHEIASFLERMQDQSRRLIELYEDGQDTRAQELQSLSTGDVFETFNRQLREIKDYHKRYPNGPVENLERAYQKRTLEEGEPMAFDVDGLFTGEEGYGRFFDLTMLHEQYLNLPGVKGTRRLTYLQYLDSFDVFIPPTCPIKRGDKLIDAYFQYLGSLASYLEGFMARTKPLEDHAKLISGFDQEFDKAWQKEAIPEWSAQESSSNTVAAPETQGSGEGIYCADCEKEFSNPNVYNHHLTQKKHKKNAEARKAREHTNEGGITNGASSTHRLKERAVAEREYKIRKLASTMQSERSDTRQNIERRQGMTERERQQELASLYAADEPANGANGEADDDDDDEDKVYNPLKLPLAWDGKPIPFWLYKLHGLGVEFPCEICGNFVYMGRRAFDKHFNESRHIYGLKCLGITNTTLFREITKIAEANTLWKKIQDNKKQDKQANDNVVEMEDSEGHVMPFKIYQDLQRQGLL